jgi:membrane associated rhomboid family serine protease
VSVEIAIRVSDEHAEIDRWTFVLAAIGIPHRIDVAEHGWALLVPDTHARDAQIALDEYDAEARDVRSSLASDSADRAASWIIGIAAGLALLAFFAVTGTPSADSRWFASGAVSTARIAHGEIWRSVTALTLHVDGVHALSNAVATALLLALVVQHLGPGVGLALTLCAGAGANLLSAIVHDAEYVAVGASTATFGAIGILSGLRLTRAMAPMRSRPWAVLGAALVLLSMFGTSRGADVLAHALGLASGGALGIAAGLALRPRAAAWIQWTLVVGVIVLVTECWLLALAAAPDTL